MVEVAVLFRSFKSKALVSNAGPYFFSGQEGDNFVFDPWVLCSSLFYT